MSVLCLFLCLTVCMVILVVRPIQAMKAAIAGIGIVDILRTDGAGVTTVTVDQVQDFFIQCSSFILGDRFPLVSILHLYHLA